MRFLLIALLLPLTLIAQLPAAPVPAERPPFQFMTADDLAHYRKFLPKVDNKVIQAVLDDPATILYTNSHIPGAYQHVGHVHDPNYNIAANPDPFGNANREMPWGMPFGTHRCGPELLAFRFVNLPGAVEWWIEQTRDGRGIIAGGRSVEERQPLYRWEFPDRTVFGEVLLIKDENGKAWPFEMRTRTKRDGKWHPDVFRPFVNRRQLEAACKELDCELPAMPTTRVIIKDRQPRKRVIDAEADLEVLPAMDGDLVRVLLARPFKSALGESWTPGKAAFAPISKEAFGIVPKGYEGGVIAVGQESCMRCHETCRQEARSFAPNREWYGRISGDDGIFSFHPFAVECISHNGIEKPVAMRQKLVDAGLLKKR